jgi:NAD-dependent dihydropyrimidine dehydrogenase PreA subunit
MPFVITEACRDVKDRGCVDACPVDCIYEGEEQLLIHVDECIDCYACVPVCPVQAIVQDVALPREQIASLEGAIQWFADHPDAANGAFTSPFAPRVGGPSPG